MSDVSYHLDQRLSLNSQTCTVRYIGKVANKAGDWLGVEWDDPSRGKNDGSHDGVRYFNCRRKTQTSASFLRPTQAWDKPRSFLQALTDKYFKVEEAQSDEIVFVSRSKQIEEVGFQKFARRQAELKGIHVLVLDRMQIATASPLEDHQSISKLCVNITDLDLSGNIFEHLDDILELCSLLPKLKRLTLGSNRFVVQQQSHIALPNIRFVSLANTLHTEDEVSMCLTSFPHAEELVLSSNAIQTWQRATLPGTLRSVDLSHNEIRSLDKISSVLALPCLRQLGLKDSQISSIRKDESTIALSNTLQELDLGRNQVSSWSFFNQLSQALPSLHSLRVSGNPLFSSLKSADGKLLAAEDGYMLTIARLPHVHTLNFSTIRENDRLNAEKYYLSQIVTELARVEADRAPMILSQHPRWRDLCKEYGEPAIDRGGPNVVDPSSLEARLVTVEFTFADTSGLQRWRLEVPRAHNIYALYGLAGKELKIMPVNLRLVWETGEQDPVSQKNDYNGPEWWDSDDEEDLQLTSEQWVTRSVELRPGTRPIGTYFEGRHALVRVELKTTKGQ